MESSIPVSNGTEKVVRVIELAPALSLTFLVLCLTLTTGVLSRHAHAEIGICLLTASLFSCFAGLCFPSAKLPNLARIPILRIATRDPVFALLTLCLLIQWMALCNWYFSGVWIIGLAPFFVLPLVWSAKSSTKSSAKIWRFATIGALLLFVLCNVLVFQGRPEPDIDVFVFQRDSSLALLRGQNPYDITFADNHNSTGKVRFYGPGVSVGGVLQFGFPYMPLTLLWIFPAQILLGDFRFAYVLSLVVGAFCIFQVRKTPIVAAAALLLLFSLPTFFVLEFGWTEPLPVMLLCVVALASRCKKSSSLAIGLLTAAKQYLVLLCPLIFLLSQEKTRAQRIHDFLKAAAFAAIVTLPFVSWNPRAFFHSAISLHLSQPFRDDALSYLAFYKMLTGVQPPTWPGFLIAIIAIAFCLWRAPRTATGFMLSVALVLFGFVSFAQQAFVNYYFLIFAALCCATALANSETTDETESLKSPAAIAAQ